MIKNFGENVGWPIVLNFVKRYKEKLPDFILVMEIKENDNYHTFKIFSFQEYYKLKNKFYEEYSKEVDTPTLEVLLQNEEK